ncbi:hypothetical protein DM01DRAFT_1326094 [Hesseltinella vesiculosa]|uniref:Peroxin-3 n=1 Tax=Hesseltinella vesiculosa TaxID=101127 RepID=A0A1X2GB76_9FUNG|nr:hypothetical protein DM01DRAFT_1326094 [Hesseltinella vesiculosa]
MAILTSVKDYVKRHRRGLFVTATLAGGTYLAGRYASNKLKEFQEKSTSERLAKENLKRRFQQNQNDCVFTVLSLLPTLGDQVLIEMNIEASWAKLQESRKLEKLAEKKRKEKEKRKQDRLEQRQERHARREQERLEKERLEQERLANAAQQEEQADRAAPDSDAGTGGHENTAADVGKDEQSDEQPSPAATEQSPLDMSIGSIADSVHSTTTSSSMIVVENQDADSEEEDEDEDDLALDGLLDKKAKYHLWEDIKLDSFSRTLVSLYSVTFLTLLTHVQLNLLGRFTYVWSVSVLNKSEPTIRLQYGDDQQDNGFLDAKTERMFLSVSWWLLHRGWRKCAERVQEAVQQEIKGLPLKSIITYEGAQDIVKNLRHRIEYEEDGTTPYSFRSWMLPDSQDEELEFLRESGFSSQDIKEATAGVSLRQLLDETKDYLDSPDFVSVLSCCLEEVYGIFNHNVFGKALLAGPLDPSVERIQEIKDDASAGDKKMTLANLLPSISRQSHLIIAGNEYLNGFAYIKELQAFSAMVYTQYGEEIEN